MDAMDELEEKVEAAILEAAMDRPGARRELAVILKRMAPDARQRALVRILGRPSLPARARALAAHGLGRSAAPSAATLEALTRALGDEEDEIAKAARATLWQLLPLAPAGVPAVEELRSGSPPARRNAAHVLRYLHWGPEPPAEARQVPPALALALDDPDATVRREAAEALSRNPWLSRAEAPPSSRRWHPTGTGSATRASATGRRMSASSRSPRGPADSPSTRRSSTR